MINDCLEHLKLVAQKYDGLSDDEKKKVRADVYRQFGRYGHILFKVGCVPSDKSVVEHLLDVTALIDSKKKDDSK